MAQSDESAAATTERPRIVNHGCHRTAIILVITGIVMFSASFLSMLWVDVHRYFYFPWFLMMLAVVIIGLGLFYEQRAFGHPTAVIWKEFVVGVLSILIFLSVTIYCLLRFGELVGFFFAFPLLLLCGWLLSWLFPRKRG